jgi:hypothetical protein
MSYAKIIENLPDELILLTEIEVEGITHRKRQTLRLDRIKGGGIPFIRVGKRQVRYRLSDVKTYLACRCFNSTTQADAARL